MLQCRYIIIYSVRDLPYEIHITHTLQYTGTEKKEFKKRIKRAPIYMTAAPRFRRFTHTHMARISSVDLTCVCARACDLKPKQQLRDLTEPVGCVRTAPRECECVRASAVVLPRRRWN